jgi:hypothetical protein
VTLTCWVSVCARAGVMGFPSGPHATHSAKLLAITAAASTSILRDMRDIVTAVAGYVPGHALRVLWAHLTPLEALRYDPGTVGRP